MAKTWRKRSSIILSSDRILTALIDTDQLLSDLYLLILPFDFDFRDLSSGSRILVISWRPAQRKAPQPSASTACDAVTARPISPATSLISPHFPARYSSPSCYPLEESQRRGCRAYVAVARFHPWRRKAAITKPMTPYHNRRVPSAPVPTTSHAPSVRTQPLTGRTSSIPTPL